MWLAWPVQLKPFKRSQYSLNDVCKMAISQGWSASCSTCKGTSQGQSFRLHSLTRAGRVVKYYSKGFYLRIAQMLH